MSEVILYFSKILREKISTYQSMTAMLSNNAMKGNLYIVLVCRCSKSLRQLLVTEQKMGYVMYLSV